MAELCKETIGVCICMSGEILRIQCEGGPALKMGLCTGLTSAGWGCLTLVVSTSVEQCMPFYLLVI